MKKIFIFILLFVFVFASFSQTPTYEQILEQLKITNSTLVETIELVDILSKENDKKDKTISDNTTLLLEIKEKIKEKDDKIEELNKIISTMSERNNNTIDVLNKQIKDLQATIDDYKKIIDDFIKKIETLQKTNSVVLNIGYNTSGNFIAGVDYGFNIWRVRFSTGVMYETPIEFGVKFGVGFNF